MMALPKDQLSRIQISGYKSIKECDVELKKINVLIGSNGAGKSNFISAFSLLQSVLDQNLQMLVAKRGLNTLLYKGRSVTEEIDFRICFGEDAYGFRLVPSDTERLIFQEEYIETDGVKEVLDHGAAGLFESALALESPRLKNKTAVSFLKRQRWRVYHFQDSGRDARMKQEHFLSNDLELQEDARNLAAFLYRLKSGYSREYFQIVNTVQLVAPFFDDFVLEPNSNNSELIRLRWKQVNHRDTLSASQLSDGTLRFICLATLLLQPIELRPPTMIIDEPELGLHPLAITVLSELIQAASVDSQLIVSTQSADLLNEFGIEDVIVVDRGLKGTEFMRLSTESLKVWLENDYSLGDLWNMNVLGGRPSGRHFE